jgi:hypothetical protein
MRSAASTSGEVRTLPPSGPASPLTLAQPFATLIENGIRLVDHGLAFRVDKPDDGVLTSPLNRGELLRLI